MTEQRDSAAKYELAELKSKHEELSISLENMQRQNNETVGPVLKQLRQEVYAILFHFYYCFCINLNILCISTYFL